MPASAETARYIDTALFWREASGPHGERNPSALPLYEAVFAHDLRRVSLLLDRGGSPNVPLYPGGWSALMVAAAFNDHPVAQALARHGADLNYVSHDPATGTPLAAALSYGRFYPLRHPDFSMFRYLLNAGADVNLEFNGDDIATYAITVGQISIVNEVLARGYRRDLPKLRRWLEVVHVDERNRPDKDRALATVNRLLRR